MSELARAEAAVEQTGPVLPDNIGVHIRIVQMRIFRAFYKAFEDSGVTPGVHTVLAIIRDNPGIRQRALADLLMVREPNMTRMIQSLYLSGMISRETDKTDRRALHLGLTDKGRALMHSVADRIDTLEQTVLSGLSADDRKTLRVFLDRILEALD